MQFWGVFGLQPGEEREVFGEFYPGGGVKERGSPGGGIKYNIHVPVFGSLEYNPGIFDTPSFWCTNICAGDLDRMEVFSWMF